MSECHNERKNVMRVFAALLKVHYSSLIRVGGLSFFGVTILLSVIANQSVKMTPSTAILYSLGGTIPRITDSLSISLQILPILIALLVWGKYLNNELCFRCQLVIPKCQSVSVWYASLIGGMTGYCAVLSIVSITTAWLGGFFVQEIFYRFGVINNINSLTLTEYLGSVIHIESVDNILIVFLCFFLRLQILLGIQLLTWLFSTKANVALVLTLFFASVSLFFPQCLFLPVGGTMLFGILEQRNETGIGLLCALVYLVFLEIAGWLYCKKTDWLMSFI